MFESADEILMVLEVNADFAADARRDDCDESGRHLDQFQPAQISCGQHSRGITNRAATDGDDYVATFDTFGKAGVIQLRQGVERLRGLSCGNRALRDLKAVTRQCFDEADTVERHDVLVRDQ